MARLSTFDLSRGIDARQLEARDLGDLPIAHLSPEEAFSTVRDAVKPAVAEHPAVVLLGGDNGATRPGLHGLGLPLERVGLLTIDAHLDMRETKDGLHNGNPVRALIDDGLPGTNVVQIGLAPFANSMEYVQDARDAGSTLVPLDAVRKKGLPQLVEEHLERLSFKVDAIYVDLDVDVLDRAFAPACPGARPGGLAPHEVAAACFEVGRCAKVKAIDIVEIDPERELNDCTCLAAGQFLLSFSCGLVARLSTHA